MRSDAARNRQRIFDEARGAVIGGETALTLNELARRAGVGVGTVYRVFPTQRAMRESRPGSAHVHRPGQRHYHDDL